MTISIKYSQAIAGLVCLIMLMATPIAYAADQQVQFKQVKVALLPGNLASGQWQAGIDINLEPGWKTYWKVPGDSGIPPVFNWSKSDNVKALKIAWPAPKRYREGDSEVVGYKSKVLFPLTIVPQDQARPVTLQLAMSFGVCKQICVPITAQLKIELDNGQPTSGFATIINQARSLVPKAHIDGVRLTEVKVQTRKEKIALLLTIPNVEDETDILVEGPEEFYFNRPQPQGNGRFEIIVDRTQKSDDLKGAQLKFTILSNHGHIVQSRKIN